ncbi:DNA repair protein RecO [Candidatus Saccharibacteria bacterium]|nr:DNA repair protein RecO [Candidatus Saccharibacteria bacterium]
MQRFSTQGIVLARTNYGEADRIITFLTPDRGKVKGFAKGVRRSKSKLAGGIELFSVSELSLIIGKSEINTIISTRLLKHYGNIVKNLDRTNLGYEFIKITNKATEDHPEQAYFDLLRNSFNSLDHKTIDVGLVEIWFKAQLLKLSGHTPNLRTDKSGKKLEADKLYDFNFDEVGLILSENGEFGTDQIKFLRLIFSDNQPSALQKVKQSPQLAGQCQQLVGTLLQNYVRL